MSSKVNSSIFFNKISTGASNDLQQITKTAYSMVTVYGMSEKAGDPISGKAGESGFGVFMQGYSEASNVQLGEELISITMAHMFTTTTIIIGCRMIHR
ncbi:MAG: hypothetical protein EOP49_42910 [Sphingobacteriales bacterium]|nr:MAG: hypothetical protein EOP49_42910 [Sphingobacteriales bacterium]